MDQLQTDNLLDKEFTRMLCLLRQHIPFVNSNTYLEQCKLWLEELSGNLNINKEFRNLYLAELCKQIQTNRILPLFDEAKTLKGNTCFGNIISSQNLNASNKQEAVKENTQNKNDRTSLKKIKQNIISNTRKAKSTNQGETKILVLKEGATDDDNDSWSDLTSDGDSDAEFNNAIMNKTDIQKTRAEKSSHGHTAKKHQSNIGYKLYFFKLEKTIATLQMRLSEICHQNRELKNLIEILEIQKLENITENKAHSTNFHRQEIDKLSEVHARNALEVENNFQKYMENFKIELEEKVNLVSCNYEQKIMETKNENERAIKNRDNEINRLSDIIQNQCLRIMNDLSSLRNQVSSCTCNKKVHILKKCVSKMDRTFQKSENNYHKQIENLRQELNLKEKALQMQMKVQNVQVVAQTRTDQKGEFEEVLNSLEVKYIKMLEGHEQQITRLRKQDYQKIEQLIELLEGHGIPYKNK